MSRTHLVFSVLHDDDATKFDRADELVERLQEHVNVDDVFFEEGSIDLCCSVHPTEVNRALSAVVSSEVVLCGLYIDPTREPHATVAGLIQSVEGMEYDAPLAYIIWQVEDALSLDDSLTEDEAAEAIHRMHSGADCSVGMSWDTLEAYVREVIWDRKAA